MKTLPGLTFHGGQIIASVAHGLGFGAPLEDFYEEEGRGAGFQQNVPWIQWTKLRIAFFIWHCGGTNT